MLEYIKNNIEEIEAKITAAAAKSGRRREDITLVAIAKTFENDITKAAVDYGIKDIGEARIQEAEPKIKQMGKICRWHMVGHLQRNKVKNAIELFDMIQSLDSKRLAGEIEKRYAAANKSIECLVEVNISGEETKYGIAPEKTVDFIQKVKNEMPHIALRGLMTIGPNVTDKQHIRESFRSTSKLFEKLKKIAGDKFDILSMGMSGDYELAVEEGSNMVRIGTAIFGERNKR